MRTEDNLAVGADIHKQGQLFGVIHTGRVHPGGDIRANVAGNPWKAVHRGFGVNFQPDFGGSQQGELVHAGDKRGKTDALSRQAEQQVGHGAVAGDGSLYDLRRVGFDPLAGGLEKAINRSQDQRAHFRGSAVFAGIDNSGNDILAAVDLLVIFGGLGSHGPAGQVH